MKTSLKQCFLLTLFLSTACAVAAQTGIRPYDQWEATAFVAVRSHQPSDYVETDNNWDILYTLRTPHSRRELLDKGIPCTESQLMLLEVGGLIRKSQGRYAASFPILDREETHSLREFANGIAEKIYRESKPDFIALERAIRQMGFQDNALSLVFSYLLDGRAWTKLTLFDDIDQNATWSGCYWVLYEPREGFKCGTNGYGEQDLIVTYVRSDIAPDYRTMDKCADEIARFGKVTDPELLRKILPYGIVDEKGTTSIPVIRRQEDEFHRLTEKLADAIRTGLADNAAEAAKRYRIADEKKALVVLYHEVMWDLLDRLLTDGILTLPDILTDPDAEKSHLKYVTFFVEGGLMQTEEE